MTDSSVSSPPQLNGYVYERFLGTGGYSDVFLYQAQQPRRSVAIKVLKDASLTDTVREQFTAEADAMASLADHPNIVPVFAADVAADGRPYIVMMYCPQDNLGLRASHERFSVERVLRIGIQVSSAVHTAHKAGILHRDIKPANILTDQFGVPRLTDFGIAAQVTAVDDEDDTGVSVPWSPPEVLYATAKASIGADVYSLAATFWHLLVGRAPFEIAGGDNTPYALMRRTRDLPVPATGRPDVPASLERLLSQAMSKNPANRPATALDFARALQSIEQELRLSRTDIVVLSEHSSSSPQRQSGSSADATQVRAPVRPTQHSQRNASGTPTTEPRVRRFFEPSVIQPGVIAPSVIEQTGDARGSSVKAGISGGTRAPEADRTAQRPATVPGTSAPAAAARSRVLPSADEPDATILRAPVVSPQQTESDKAPSRANRKVIALAVAVCVVLSVAVAVVISSSGKRETPRAATPTTGDADQALLNQLPPGAPNITIARVDAATIRFSWTYSSSLPDDTYRVKVNDQESSPTLTKPTIDIPAPTGTQTCVQVKVVRASGADALTPYLPDPAVCGS